MENQELIARDTQCVMQTYGRFPIAIDHGQGALLYDVEGQEYVDFTAGIGRTGTLFAYQQYGILPDVVSFAKGIGGGLPLGGILANEKCRNVLGPGMHATTFGGNPVSCAGGCAVLEQLSDDVLEEVKIKGELIRDYIEGMHSPYVAGVRGLGLMIGVQLTGISHKELAQRCIDRGLLVLTAGTDTLRLLPPLTITREEILRGLDILHSVLCE